MRVPSHNYRWGSAAGEESLLSDKLTGTDKAFRTGFFQAMLESQDIGEGVVYEVKPGQRYRGPIVVLGSEHLLQQVASMIYIAHQAEVFATFPQPDKSVAIQNGTLVQEEAYQALSPQQQDQAAARFSGYWIDDYRYQLDREGGVLCRKPERDFEQQTLEH